MRTIRGATTLAAMMTLALAACSDGTAPTTPDEARMQVQAEGDTDAGTTGQSATGDANDDGGWAMGTVSFDARVFVQSSAGQWTELTNAASSRTTLDASGRGSAAVLANAEVDAGAYARVRIVFRDVRANVTGDASASTNLLTGALRVDLGTDGEVVVERTVSVNASAGTTSRMTVDVNADAWLASANAATRLVTESAFASAVRVRAE